MHILTAPLRSRYLPRTIFFHARSTRKSTTTRTIATTSILRGILGLERRTHHAKPTPTTRGPTRVELLLRKAEEKADPKRIKVYPCPMPSARALCRDPIASLTARQLEVLDPTGMRTKLFDKMNRDGIRVGDILLVRTKSGDPVSGVCINIRRRGVDTTILLRNQLTRVGVEMWIKIYSPNVEGIEVVQKARKRARRARLYYMRQPKHDMGSVQNIVQQYQRQRQALRPGSSGGYVDRKSPKRQNKNKKK